MSPPRHPHPHPHPRFQHALGLDQQPGLEDFIRGFSVSNDIVQDLSEIYDVRLSHFDQACQADVQISSRAFWALKNHRRQMASTRGCGLCGVDALEQALPQLDILAPAALPPRQSGPREHGRCG